MFYLITPQKLLLLTSIEHILLQQDDTDTLKLLESLPFPVSNQPKGENEMFGTTEGITEAND